MGTVKVACHHPNGIAIRMFRTGWDDGTGSGFKPTVPVGPIVVLNGPKTDAFGTNLTSDTKVGVGYTDIDEEWMNAWIEQNKGKNPFLDSGVVYVVKEEAAPEPVPDNAPQIDAAPVLALPPPEVDPTFEIVPPPGRDNPEHAE